MLHRVPDDRSFNMVGPYLSRRAQCPVCGKTNILLHHDHIGSPIRSEKQACRHLRAFEMNDDGDGTFEFETSAADDGAPTPARPQ